ncbi:MAG TPA: ligase-associated DNA damage response exonuclease [Verrucomicrobiae bacterium]|nr:ligase-associated DNA damage response exonuclease [Verrucomicrobiae bacterium]
MLLQTTERGIYCPAGDFYIDPWRPVDRAVITHGHSDHARAGSRQYLTEESGRGVLRARLGPEAVIETVRYGESLTRDGVRVSLHPAGHILGSAQVRIERAGEIAVVSGDYKVEADGLCAPFEAVRCHTFVTESTFGLPIYRWRPQAEIFREINDWWRENQSQERTSVLFCYSLGKAQRLLHGLDGALGPIFLHGAAESMTVAYEEAGVTFPAWSKPDVALAKNSAGRAMVLAPMSADNTPWLRKFGDVSTAFASGWMTIRGARRRRSLDRGFVLSDHADWRGLLEAIDATGAEDVWVTHGYTAPVVRWLQEHGRRATAVETRFAAEGEEAP